MQVFIYLSFEICDAPTQTGAGAEAGQPQNAVLALPCQRGFRWRKAAVDYTCDFSAIWFRGRTDSLRSLCTLNQSPEGRVEKTPTHNSRVDLRCQRYFANSTGWIARRQVRYETVTQPASVQCSARDSSVLLLCCSKAAPSLFHENYLWR